MRRSLWLVLGSVGLVLMSFGCSENHSLTGVIPKAPVEVESDYPPKVFDAYSRLMNDEGLIKEGVVGSTRLGIIDAASLHNNTDLKDPLRLELVELRKSEATKGTHAGDGMISVAVPGTRGRTLGSVSFWSGTQGSRGMAFRIRDNENFADAAKEAAKAVLAAPKDIFEREVAAGKLYARAILFEKEMCLKCHPGAKVNDVAAVSAVFIAKDEVERHAATSTGTSPPPEGIEDSLKLHVVPGGKVDRSSFRFSKEPTFDYLTLDLTSSMSVDEVVAYYEKHYRSISGATVSRPHKRSVAYEFGDEFFGTIYVTPMDGATRVFMSIGRQTVKPK